MTIIDIFYVVRKCVPLVSLYTIMLSALIFYMVL
jgi:hypothetical protein